MSSTNRSSARDSHIADYYEKEYFIDILGYENYQISQYGNVKNKITNKILKFSLRKGYKRVSVYNNGQRKTINVHRYVATLFIPNINNKPQVNHKNGDKQDDYYKNLEWCNNSENQIHAWKNGLQKRTENHKRQINELTKINKQTKRTLTNEQVIYIREQYKTGSYSYKHFANMFNVSGKTIEYVIKNIRYKEVI